MFEVAVYNLEGEKIGQEKLDKDFFGVNVAPELVELVIMAHRNAQRKPWAHTKTKGEVRGGGRKPWKQKGTGNARQGSIRAPQWRGGGVTFGPRKERNYEMKINKKVKNKVLKFVLADKIKNNHLILLDNFEIKEAKTKILSSVLKKLKIKSGLISLAQKNDNIIRAAKNLPKIGLVAANSLNVFDLVKHEYFVLDKSALKKIIEVYK